VSSEDGRLVRRHDGVLEFEREQLEQLKQSAASRLRSVDRRLAASARMGESPRHASAPAPHRMRRKRPARGGDGAST